MKTPSRRAYIDWARGIAVLLMIEAHATDAWTRPDDKKSIGYAVATILGGFAAPLFLWLAGLGVALAISRAADRTGSRAQAVEAASRRGLEIFLLAFLFRLQAFIVSPPSTPLKLFRVDILNVMGPAMFAAAILWMAATGTKSRVAVYTAAATAFAMATPIVRSAAAVDRLPIWFQWYLRPAGEFTTFTLLPWAGFVFAGAAVGALLAEVRDETIERRLHFGLASAGVLLIAGGFLAAAQPSIYAHASFWTSSPTWFGIRTGILMIALSLCFVTERISHETARVRNRKPRTGFKRVAHRFSGAFARLKACATFRVFVSSWQAPLARMGRASLFVYWIHVELVYGYASWLWRGRLPFWGAVIGYILFCVAMYGAIEVRDRVVANWRRIRPSLSTA
jgi:uncharacterized membrane protein